MGVVHDHAEVRPRTQSLKDAQRRAVLDVPGGPGVAQAVPSESFVTLRHHGFAGGDGTITISPVLRTSGSASNSAIGIDAIRICVSRHLYASVSFAAFFNEASKACAYARISEARFRFCHRPTPVRKHELIVYPLLGL